MQSAIIFIGVQKKLAAWHIKSLSTPKRQMLQGDAYLPITAPDNLVGALRDIEDRLKGDDSSYEVVHWILDQNMGQIWQKALPELQADQKGKTLTQLVSWEWIKARLGLHGDPFAIENTMLQKKLVPWLVSVDDAVERKQMQEALQQEHDNESQRLAQERARLEHENLQLREMNQALQQIELENLVRFLPALFPRIFKEIGAHDLALLCGHIEPANIPNPYPEPSEETIYVLQKDFRILPRRLQKQIVEFVVRLPQRQKIKPRPEMRDLIFDLEQELL